MAFRSIYEFYAQGSSYQELHDQNRQNKSLWSRYVADTTFKFLVTAYKHRIPQTYQREVMESFDYMDFKGRIDMKNPEIVLGCFEECTIFIISALGEEVKSGLVDELEDLAESIRGTRKGDQRRRFRRAYFGRLVRLMPPSRLTVCGFARNQVEDGSARSLITVFDVKKRVYFGNTSMEAEISLVMANQALVRT
jgi:tRNA (guanine10-N2)-methyltransferase